MSKRHLLCNDLTVQSSSLYITFSAKAHSAVLVIIFVVLLCYLNPTFLPLLPTPSPPSSSSSHPFNPPVPYSKPPPEPALQTCFKPSSNPSVYSGGIPGFTVLSHVWYRERVLYAFSSDSRGAAAFPTIDEISGGSNIRAIRVLPRSSLALELATQPPAKAREFDGLNFPKCFKGTTLFLNDGGEHWSWTYFNWFYHFAAEDLLGPMAALGGLPEAENGGMRVPERIIIPHDEGWRDPTGMGDAMVKGTFGELIEQREWEDISWAKEDRPAQWLYFSRIVIVDRITSHKYNKVADSWNKMALEAFALPRAPNFWEPFRSAFLSSLSIPIYARSFWPGTPTSSGTALVAPAPGPGPHRTARALIPVPKIIYVSRQPTSRRLRSADDTGLRAALERLEREGKARASVVTWETMELADQVRETSDADVVLGIHGNGLTHGLWMPRGGKVIEFFPAGAFLRDYEAPMTVVGHEHIAIWEDRIYPRKEWELHPGEMNPSWLHNGTEIPLDVAFIDGLLRRVVASMTK